MLDLDRLVVAEEVDLVLARDRAAAHGVDADLLALAALGLGVPAEDVGLVRKAGLLHRVGDEQRRAGGRVHLGVVVLFHDLDVELRQGLGRLLHKVQHHVDAQRHVRGLKDRDHLRGALDGLQLLGGVAGRGQHEAHAPLRAVGDQVAQRVRPGEVHDHVRRELAVVDVLVQGIIGGGAGRVAVHARDDGNALRRGGLGQRAAHLAARAVDENRNHGQTSFFVKTRA